MITNTVPKKGEIWQHFKGGQYKILGVARTDEIYTESMPLPSYYAQHTEDSILFAVYKLGEDLIINQHPEELVINEKYVIYRDIHLAKPTIFARKLKNFLELIPKNSHQHHYRFLRITNQGNT
jgi:hypothetical protein